METNDRSFKENNKALHGRVLGVWYNWVVIEYGHIWVFIQLTRFGALTQLDMFRISETSMWTRFGGNTRF